jgi:hypothetical protein
MPSTIDTYQGDSVRIIREVPTQVILRKILPTKKLARLCFEGQIEFGPFLRAISTYSNIDELLADSAGLKKLKNLGFRPRSGEDVEVYNIVRKAQDTIPNFGWYNVLKGNVSEEHLSELREISPFRKKQRERLALADAAKPLEECLRSESRLYLTPECVESTGRFRGDVPYVDISFVGNGKVTSQRNAYIKRIQQNLRRYDLSIDPRAFEVMEEGEQLNLF